MADGSHLTEYRLQVAEDRIGELAQDLTKMQIMFERRERERTQEERRKLWAGLTTLGGMVLTLIGVIWWIVRDTLFRQRSLEIDEGRNAGDNAK